MVLDENLHPSGKTYSRRANQLVIKGRARWKDSSTIQMIPSTSSFATEDVDRMNNIAEETIGDTAEKITENDMQSTESMDMSLKAEGNAMAEISEIPGQKPFKVGDVVTLNSGGVLMTVMEPPTKSGTVYCQWWANSEFSAQSFPIQTLKLHKA